MSVLATLNNIKIPYATEGVIRTAQLDDTVAPVDSVQLAVNMNFDRVGALQTRPGVTQFADDLVDSINNYGTLKNAVIPPGFDFIFQLGSTSEFTPNQVNFPTAVKISDQKIVVFWTNSTGHGYGQMFSIDEAVGSVSPLGSALNFETNANAQNKAFLMLGNIVLNVWQRGSGTTGAAWAQAFNTDGDNLTPGAQYNFDSAGFNFAIGQIDSVHAIVFYAVTSGANIATILAVNNTTLAITEPGSDLNFASGSNQWNSCQSVTSDHFLNTWTNAGVINAQVFSVNTGTWAITAIGSPLTLSGTGTESNLINTGDNQHYVDFFKQSNVFICGQVLNVNLSTFAVTAVGTPLPNTFVATQAFAATKIDGTHFVTFGNSNAGHGEVHMVLMDGSFNLTFIANQLSGYDFNGEQSITALQLSTTEVLAVWGGFTGEDGQAAMFKPYGNVVNGNWLYAGHGTKVSNTPAPGGAWTDRRSGLAQVSKVRFAQYLNYIWMVNGNLQIGGDSIATSNGGNFGSDLVPANFPGGDFIQAGFEGRVWVANKTLGVIYYTDIVQFVPPTTYILTYNPEVNFLSQLAPQTGETITALFEVPRALLVFTENTITRIYGASSVDAYPAYNVGTYSQESIIQTKTGIFFHHSSGFYQFDYGSQPVEISRRIIDFVKAIPRANYDDVLGVWDGFDNVEWCVGAVTVEGVAFSNCYVRYTISTQVWTIYDYPLNATTALIYYDNGVTLSHIAAMTNTVGAALYKTGALDTGTTDFGQPFYFEYIDRWRAFTEMYYQSKSISGMSVYSENAAGSNVSYQLQKTGPNAWIPIFTITEENNSLSPNSGTDPFDVIRIRIAGNTKGAPIVIHGIEITSLTILGQDEN